MTNAKVEAWERAKVQSLTAETDTDDAFAEQAIEMAGDALAAEVARLETSLEHEQVEVRLLSERIGPLMANPCRRCGCLSEDAEQPPPQTGACGGGGELGSRWVCPSCEEVARLEAQAQDAHLSIRQGYDKTVADAWRAEVEKWKGLHRESLAARIRAEEQAEHAVAVAHKARKAALVEAAGELGGKVSPDGQCSDYSQGHDAGIDYAVWTLKKMAEEG